MKSEDLIKAIERQYNKSRDAYFSYAWREKVNEFLSDESKYARLVDWINDRIDFNRDTIDVFNPADRTEQYNNGFFKKYCEACKELAMLINFKEIILDNHCTTKMRENIEYAICKFFNIHYNEQLRCYV